MNANSSELSIGLIGTIQKEHDRTLLYPTQINENVMKTKTEMISTTQRNQ